MDEKAVEAMSSVCQKLAKARVCISNMFAEEKPQDYFKFRDLIFDCETIMAKYCDCAPIKLISGQVSEIMENYNNDISN